MANTQQCTIQSLVLLGLPGKMKSAALRVLPFVFLWANADYNPKPCLPTNGTSSYETFLERHVVQNSPQTFSASVWEEFLRNHSLCHRPTQSFLLYSMKEQVNAVCSPAGGKLHTGNLCISKEPFSFFTVRTKNGKLEGCKISEVVSETKHIILGCDTIENICMPVHFEGNPNGQKPRSSTPDCQRPLPASSRPLKAADNVIIFCFSLISVLVF